MTNAFHDYTIHYQPHAASESRRVSLAFCKMKHLPPVVTLVAKSAPFIGSRMSGDNAVRREEFNQGDLRKSRLWRSSEKKLPDHKKFLRRSPVSVTLESTSGSHGWILQNQALHPTALRAGRCRKLTMTKQSASIHLPLPRAVG